jgi:hypothetical protein
LGAKILLDLVEVFFHFGDGDGGQSAGKRCGNPIPVMRAHLPAPDHRRMGPAPAAYLIRIDGHLGATMLSAFLALAPHQHGGHTVLTGLLDRAALYAVLAAIEALGLDLLEIRKLPPDRESPGSGQHRSP